MQEMVKWETWEWSVLLVFGTSLTAGMMLHLVVLTDGMYENTEWQTVLLRCCDTGRNKSRIIYRRDCSQKDGFKYCVI